MDRGPLPVFHRQRAFLFGTSFPPLSLPKMLHDSGRLFFAIVESGIQPFGGRFYPAVAEVMLKASP